MEHRYWVLQNGCPEHHLTHDSPLNFDLTSASLFNVANFLMWAQVKSRDASWMTVSVMQAGVTCTSFCLLHSLKLGLEKKNT